MSAKRTIMPALFAMLNDDETVNTLETRKYVRFLVSQGVRDFYINGSTGEAFLLSTDERKRLLDIIADEVNSDCFLMVQIGTISTKESIELAKHAEKTGAHAISAITPFYYQFSWDEIENYYLSILDSVDLPLCPYYFPNLSGVSVSRKQLGRLLSHQNVKYLKYTSTDFYTLQRLKNEFPEIYIFNGFDEMLLSGIMAGADGAIGSTYNFTYNHTVSMVKLIDGGEITEAQYRQNGINNFVDTLLDVGGVWQGAKYLLRKYGIDAGNPANPFLPISKEGRIKIDQFFEENLDMLTVRK